MLFLLNAVASLGQAFEVVQIPAGSRARPSGVWRQAVMAATGTLIGWPLAFIPGVLIPLGVFGARRLWVLLVTLVLGWAMVIQKPSCAN